MTEHDINTLLAKASALRNASRVEEAIAVYEQLLTLRPDLPESWYNLGWLQRQARRFDAALQSYAQAIDRGVSQPEEVHLNRAVILSDCLHRPDDAECELLAAIDRNARYVPALLNLGNLYEDRGDRDAARSANLRALEADPDNSLALARLAALSHAAELDEALALRLQDALKQPHRSPAERADMGFALAGLLDAAGHYEAAFRAATDANDASRDAAGPTAHYDHNITEQMISRLMAAFDRPVSGSMGDPAAPVFICGLFRSGSTLVEQILAGHSQVIAGGEIDLITQLVARTDGYPEAVARASSSTVQHLRDDYLHGLPPHGDKLLTDKRPDNFLHIGLIKTLFPAAKIIHTRRDRLDNLLSLYFLHLDPGMAYALDLKDLAHWYGQYQNLMDHWKALYPNDIFDVDYDRLVREPESVVEGLLRFLGLRSEDGLLDFHRRSTTVKTASVWQVRQPLHTQSSGRWRNYRKQLEPIATPFRA